MSGRTEHVRFAPAMPQLASTLTADAMSPVSGLSPLKTHETARDLRRRKQFSHCKGKSPSVRNRFANLAYCTSPRWLGIVALALLVWRFARFALLAAI